ncbi:MAG: c-type cytochrome [Giesbergeria sp.]
MNEPATPTPRSQERRQTRVLMAIVGATAGLAILTVLVFNLRSQTLFNSNSQVQADAPQALKVRAQAPVPETAPEPATASDEAAGTEKSTSEASQGQVPRADKTVSEPSAQVAPVGGFSPPADAVIPEGPMGDVIRRGEQIFLHTGANASAFVGNSLNCVNCHLDAGRKANSAPLWGAWPMYPAYRSKTKHVDTFAERLRGCFTYSMNGTPPPFGDDVLVALEAYAYWMSKGAPAGQALPGAGYPKLPKAEKEPDRVRGQAVFQANCVLCHGADGQGQRVGDAQVFPPLWGPQSYNWGAGMHKVDTAAAFIQANMPLGKGGSLSVQDAWDVAYFIDSHERPQDPRFTGDVAATRDKFHKSEYSLYGTEVDGKLLGSRAH